MRVPRMAATILLACAVVSIGAALLPFAFVKSGLFDVGAASPHTKLTEWLTHETMIHSVRRHARAIEAPPSFSRAQVLGGFCTYESHCVACHGASAVPRDRWVSGLEPQPPYLLDSSQQFTSAQLFWIVSHGIKMTGMPSWRGTLTDDQIWDAVALLQAMPKMPPQTYQRWRTAQRCAAVNPPPIPGQSPIPRP
jgi:mono/diheme cytochrome c family protein